MVRVKICGITRLEDAQHAVRCGADALGFVFANSPRRVQSSQVKAILESLGPWVSAVGVFVNSTPREILKVASECRLDCIQLHGEESPQGVASLHPYKVIKTFRVGELFSELEPKKYAVDAYLFETPSALKGGTGKTWDWTRLKTAKLKKPFIVSGGLNVSNVRKAVAALHPYAVDVSSGVEKSPGIKDPVLVEKFIRYAKAA